MTQTKQSLIDAFIQLVNVKDFEKITIADLTNGARVNRATFYAHFTDKYDLLDYTIGDSAAAVIEQHMSGIVSFDQNTIHRLILAVCEFNQQPNIPCRRSYLSLIPLLKEKMIIELERYLNSALDHVYSEMDKKLYVPIFANMIFEAGYLWATEKVMYDKEEVASKIARFVMGGCELQ